MPTAQPTEHGKTVKRTSAKGTKRGDGYCTRSSGQNHSKVRASCKAWGYKRQKSVRVNMTKPTKMTELEAVNVLLTTIGEAPVNTLTGNQVTDVTIARQVLNEVSREVQSQGWYFNTENGVTLTPDNNTTHPTPC